MSGMLLFRPLTDDQRMPGVLRGIWQSGDPGGRWAIGDADRADDRAAPDQVIGTILAYVGVITEVQEDKLASQHDVSQLDQSRLVGLVEPLDR
jgi:hypothetical protein